MNQLTSKSLRLITATLGLLFALVAINAKAVTTYYWDVNGATAGSGGPTPNGNWEDQNWTTDQSGGSATVSWVEGNYPYFAADSDATDNYTVTANNNHAIAGIAQLGGGTVTLTGSGILTLADGVQGFSGNLIINNGFIREVPVWNDEGYRV